MKRISGIIIVLLIGFSTFTYAQDYTRTTAKYLTWGVLQLVPSPVIYQDANTDNARVQFGLRWHVTPLSISFRTNKYTTPFQFFMVNPVRRFTGSAEIFVQPEWQVTSKYSGYDKFSVSAGGRIVFPIKGDGEIFSGSIGAKYTARKNSIDDSNGYYGIEAGFYVLFGLVGIQANYNFNDKSRYNVGLYFKYF